MRRDQGGEGIDSPARHSTVCRWVRERLLDYLDGSLPEPERLTFQAHVAECDACRIEARAARSAEEALSSLLSAAPEFGDLRPAFYARLAASRQLSRKRAAWSGVGAIAVVAIGSLLFAHRSRPSPIAPMKDGRTVVAELANPRAEWHREPGASSASALRQLSQVRIRPSYVRMAMLSPVPREDGRSPGRSRLRLEHSAVSVLAAKEPANRAGPVEALGHLPTGVAPYDLLAMDADNTAIGRSQLWSHVETTSSAANLDNMTDPRMAASFESALSRRRLVEPSSALPVRTADSAAPAKDEFVLHVTDDVRGFSATARLATLRREEADGEVVTIDSDDARADVGASTKLQDPRR